MGTSKSHKNGFTIQLLLFSGREDPEWTADKKTAADIERQVEAAAADGNQQPWPSRLGYRGVSVCGPAVQYVFFNGRIAVTIQNKTVYKTDAGRLLEKTLLRTMPQAVKEELGPFINKEVSF